MTGEDIREALKWSLIATVIVALWCGVLAVRKARAAVPNDSEILNSRQESGQEDDVPSQDLQAVWVIVVYEVKQSKLVGIAEFVFASYQDCQSGAEEARQKLGLYLKPVCYLRWMKQEHGSNR